MANCFRCDPVVDTGYPPGWQWPPGWGGIGGGGPQPPIYPLDALAIFTVVPTSAVCGSPALTVKATGQNFTATTTFALSGAAAPLVLGRATNITPTSADLTVNPVPELTPRTGQITCADPAPGGYGPGLGSCAFTFTAKPILTMTCPVVPASVLVNSGAGVILVNGTLFTATTIAMLDGVDQVTTLVSPTQVSFPFTPGAVAANHTVSVKDGTTTATTTCPFQVTLTPLLTVTCPVAPATAVAGSTTPLTVTVTGTNFTTTTIATADGVDQTTTFGSATSISFSLTIPATVATTQTIQIGAKDGANTAVVTCPFTVTPIAAVLPIITCPLVPATAVAGTPDLVVTVNGQNFNANCEVRLDGVRATGSTYVSATQMRYTMPMRTETTARQAIVSVYDTVAAVGTATTCPFDVTAVIRPTLTKVWPDMIGMDDAVKTCTITGTNFDATSIAICTVTPMATTYISPTQISFQTVSPMWTNGGMTLRVQNGGIPQGISTNDLLFEVRTNPGKTSPLNLDPATQSAPAGSAPMTVRLGGSGFGDPCQATVDGVGVPTTRSGGVLSFTIDPGPLTPGTVLQISGRMGHGSNSSIPSADHPEGHDDVKPVPMQQVPFTIT